MTLRAFVGEVGVAGRLKYHKACDPPVNAIVYWWRSVLSSGDLNCKSVTGTNYAMHRNCTWMGPVNSDAFGIVVGTGTTPPTVSDYSMETKITHGTGAGQLSYAAETVPTAPTTSGTKRYFEHQRQFTNNSGAQITVNEIGIIGRQFSAAYYFLICRDVLASGVDVPNTKVLTVKYKVTIQI